ncbi:MAG: NAD(P)-dependent oxidoreductase [Gemmatimonadota bacterium]|nr:NAD(P)-dependent oxidoreductase [Gemmatimonadota bacterium]
MKVVIYGGNGMLGPHVVNALEGCVSLRITDLEPFETPHETMAVDVADPDAVMCAAEGMDAIINLSVLRPHRKIAFDVNALGCYNVMRAAVTHGIRRVINTGPHFTVEGEPYTAWDYGIGPDVPPKPSTNLYALSKGLGQEICRIFASHCDVYVLCYLFCIFRDHDAASEPVRDWPFLVSWRDAAAAFLPGLTIEPDRLPSRCEVFNIFGDRPHGQFTNEKAKRILGWQPGDGLEYTYLKK